jgi:carbamoylphosphate synthase large subunit
VTAALLARASSAAWTARTRAKADVVGAACAWADHLRFEPSPSVGRVMKCRLEASLLRAVRALDRASARWQRIESAHDSAVRRDQRRRVAAVQGGVR